MGNGHGSGNPACEHPLCAHAIRLRHTPILSVLVATAYNSVSYQNVAYVSLGTQTAFVKDVKSLITTMKEMGNPFWDTS